MKQSAKPWVKQWRPRAGSAFEAEVGGPAKHFFRGLFVYADERGRVALSSNGETWQAVGRLLGFPPKERRPIKRYLDELIRHGCLRESESARGRRLDIVNFRTWQNRSVDREEAPRTGTGEDPDGYRTDAGQTPDGYRTDAGQDIDLNLSARKQAPKIPRGREEEEEEGEKKEAFAPSASIATILGTELDSHWAELRRTRGRPTEPRIKVFDRNRFAQWAVDIVPECAEGVAANPEFPPAVAVARMAMVRFLDDPNPKLVAANHPFSWLLAQCATYHPGAPT